MSSPYYAVVWIDDGTLAHWWRSSYEPQRPIAGQCLGKGTTKEEAIQNAQDEAQRIREGQ